MMPGLEILHLSLDYATTRLSMPMRCACLGKPLVNDLTSCSILVMTSRQFAAQQKISHDRLTCGKTSQLAILRHLPSPDRHHEVLNSTNSSLFALYGLSASCAIHQCLISTDCLVASRLTSAAAAVFCGSSTKNEDLLRYTTQTVHHLVILMDVIPVVCSVHAEHADP